MSIERGVLYVVATPIGNLGDISHRALEVLAGVDRIAAEDTRHTAKLLAHFGIKTPQLSLHEHNEAQRARMLIDRLRAGESIALVSDAGTPLISDPGYRLVHQARGAGIRVSPVPGASALIAALSVCGLPTDRFVFEGFLPAKAAARRTRLMALKAETRTLVFYESSHRILSSLEDLAACLGGGREAVIARELTKTFEQLQSGSLAELAAWVAADPHRSKGEFVLMVHGAGEEAGEASDGELRRLLEVLLAELPVKQAARLAARLLDVPKHEAYRRALALKAEDDPADN